MESRRLSWADYLVFVTVLGISASIGIFHAIIRRKSHTSKTEFLLASHQMKWIPAGISILVTFQSAILYIGVPAEVYTYGMSYFLFHVGMAISVVIAALYFVPLLYPLKLISTYEYLERRFQSRVPRIVGCILGMLNMILYMGVVIYAPSTSMEAVSGIPAYVCIIVTTVLAMFYTTLGGLRAVIWTDVFQCGIMIAGLLAVLIQGFRMHGGFMTVWNISEQGGRIDFGGFDPDPKVRHTVWSLVIGGTLTWLANIGVNQANVQRFSAVPRLRDARSSVILSLPGFVVLGALASFVGLIVYAYFVTIQCDPLQHKVITNSNQLVALFVMEVFHFLPGFSGLFVASLFSASLSTVSSSINSLAAMLWEDIVKVKFKVISEKKATIIIKCFVLLFGVVGMAVAFVSMQLGGPATQIALSFFGASGGPLLGMFLLGSLFPCANAKGASTGAIVGLALCLWIAIGSYTISPSPRLPPASTLHCSNLSWTNDGASPVYANGHNESLDGLTTAADPPLTDPPAADSSPMEPLYRVSYLWYSGIGVMTTIAVGLVISALTGLTKVDEVDPQLIFPICDKICCCLPERVRSRLCCDRERTQTATETDTKRPAEGIFDNPSVQCGEDFLDDGGGDVCRDAKGDGGAAGAGVGNGKARKLDASTSVAANGEVQMVTRL